MTGDRLFDPGPGARDGKLSSDRRRTIRNKAMLEAGIHPVTKLELIDDPDARCGNCSSLHRHTPSRKTYLKCSSVIMTGGPATDVRASWPGCSRWEPIDKEASQ